jgi:hypothetical protein
MIRSAVLAAILSLAAPLGLGALYSACTAAEGQAMVPAESCLVQAVLSDLADIADPLVMVAQILAACAGSTLAGLLTVVEDALAHPPVPADASAVGVPLSVGYVRLTRVHVAVQKMLAQAEAGVAVTAR